MQTDATSAINSQHWVRLHEPLGFGGRNARDARTSERMGWFDVSANSALASVYFRFPAASSF